MNERVAILTGAGTASAGAERTQVGDAVGTTPGNRGAQRRATTAQWTFRNVDGDRNLELASREFVRIGRDVFRRWDRNQDGNVSENELYGGMFGTFDRDGDRRISTSEFRNAWSRWGATFDQRVRFGVLDADGDGWLTENEFGDGLRQFGFREAWAGGVGGNLGEGRFSRNLFGVWDRNADRVVDNREFGEYAGWNWF